MERFLVMRLVATPRSRMLIASWSVPLLVAVLVWGLSERRIGEACGALLALGVVVWAVRHPGSTLVALLIFVVFFSFGFGILLHFGIPATILRYSSVLKELLAISLLVAGGRELLAHRTHLSKIDKLILAYVGAATLYLVVPGIFAADVSHQWSVRLLAWRADCGYLLVYLGVRHAPLDPSTRRRAMQAVSAMAAVVFALGFWQWADRAGFTHFALHTADAVRYQTAVLHNSPTGASSTLQYLLQPSGSLRVGSVFFSPFDLADFSVVILGLHLERASRGQRSFVSLGLCAGALAMIAASQVRADALAAIFVVCAVLLPTRLRVTSARLQVLLGVVVAVAIVLPGFVGSRFSGAQGGAASSHQHVNEVTHGLAVIEHHPVGLGIGFNPVTGSRFLGYQAGSFVSDNSVLQVGDELGLQAMTPWLLAMIAVAITLARRSRQHDTISGGAWLAFLGVLVAGQFHHVFLTYPVPWALWAVVGLALRDDAPAGGPTERQVPQAATVSSH